MRTTDLLILDFCKAFDTVPHRRLLGKLNHYGIGGKTNKWIESWFCHRNQKVVLDGSSSPDSSVLSGVPHETVLLGPLMFLLYVNNIGDKHHHEQALSYLLTISISTVPSKVERMKNNYKLI